MWVDDATAAAARFTDLDLLLDHAMPSDVLVVCHLARLGRTVPELLTFTADVWSSSEV